MPKSVISVMEVSPYTVSTIIELQLSEVEEGYLSITTCFTIVTSYAAPSSTLDVDVATCILLPSPPELQGDNSVVGVGCCPPLNLSINGAISVVGAPVSPH